MIVELAVRRRLALARLQKRREAAAIERQRDTEPVDHVGAAIAASKRAHPSAPRVYDREVEG